MVIIMMNEIKVTEIKVETKKYDLCNGFVLTITKERDERVKEDVYIISINRKHNGYISDIFGIPAKGYSFEDALSLALFNLTDEDKKLFEYYDEDLEWLEQQPF